MSTSRRDALKSTACGCMALALSNLLPRDALAHNIQDRAISDRLTMLPAGAIKLDGYLERYIQRSIGGWSKGVVPYKALAEFFRNGRPHVQWHGRDYELFAAGEMWGKAVRSAALFYRYTGDAELKAILSRTVTDILSTRRENGTISCAPVSRQPDGPGGDVWERKYVLLGLESYYEHVEPDPAVLKAMIDEADATVRQVGPPPKIPIVDLGWSVTHIESSAILEPIVRLYQRTGQPHFLEFARYIVEVAGGAKGHRLVDEVLDGRDPKDIGGEYPKAYEMLSIFEGLLEYYRVTGNDRWRQASLNFFREIIDKEITIIGNGGGDQPYHPKMMGEGWDNTALEQTNPKMTRMMETCTGVTWMKFCHQIARLTANPLAMDYIELYIYNGLIGALKPGGDGFSYVNLLNGVKTEARGWGTTISDVYITCCNLNGPTGLAYIPIIAVMRDAEGAVVNLYNACSATVPLSTQGDVRLKILTSYPVDGEVRIQVTPRRSQTFAIKLRIPAWSKTTTLKVNGESVDVQPGTYASIKRLWAVGDEIQLSLDMRCRLVQARRGSSPGSDRYHALVRGPVVLARDENIDPHFDMPVDIVNTNGIVAIEAVPPASPRTNMQFNVPTRNGTIPMVDYASVNSWTGKKAQTWLPIKTMRA